MIAKNVSATNAGQPLEDYFANKRIFETAKQEMETISKAFKESENIVHNQPYIVNFNDKYYSFEVSVNTRKIVDNARVAEALITHGDSIENYKKSSIVKYFNASEGELFVEL